MLDYGLINFDKPFERFGCACLLVHVHCGTQEVEVRGPLNLKILSMTGICYLGFLEGVPPFLCFC